MDAGGEGVGVGFHCGRGGVDLGEGIVREWWGTCGGLPGCVGLCRVLDSILLAKHAILVQCV